MLDEFKDESFLDQNSEITTEELLPTVLDIKAVEPVKANLSEESCAIIEQIVSSTDEAQTEYLTHLFNRNQTKKTLVRVNKLNDLMDTITDQALARFTQKPDEISNKELFDGLKIVQDLIERGQKQATGVEEVPLIQVNQQTNEVNIGDTSSKLDKASRERVKNVVLDLLNNINKSTNVVEDAIDASEIAEEGANNG